VQPVHDQHDRSRKLVIQATVQGMVVQLVRRLLPGLRQRLLGLQGIVDDDDVHPGPVRTPPTGVAPRPPYAVVSNSGTACRRAERRVGRAVGGDDPPAVATICRRGPGPPGYARDRPSPLKPEGDAQDLRARVVAQGPGRKDDRGQMRLQVAQRRADDHPPAPALAHRCLPGRRALAGGRRWRKPGLVAI